MFETETQEDVELRLNPLVLSALGVDIRTALWRANKLKLDWEKQACLEMRRAVCRREVRSFIDYYQILKEPKMDSILRDD